MSDPYSFAIRKAERDATCRFCSEKIPRGEQMVGWRTALNECRTLYFHLECVNKLNERVLNHQKKE